MRTRGLLAGLCALALGGALVLACSRTPQSKPVARVLVVGVDGLEWNVLRPLLAQGKCPNLRALMERGSFGRLATMEPTLSPILWTTIATGRPPEQHGVLGFLDPDGRPYSSSQRKVRAVWNIADVHGLSANVMGWWITWPVEEIRGTMVSGSSSPALVEQVWKPALIPGVPRQVHPAALAAEILELSERSGALPEVRRLAREKVFGEIPEKGLGPVEKRLVQETLWSIQSDATFFAIAKEALRARPADLEMVYFGGPDVVGHRFWRYHEPGPFKWSGTATPEAERALAGALARTCEWVDEMLGELVAAAGPGVTVIVCSDHGMHADFTEAPHPKGLSGHHMDAPPGVIVAAGPGIARGGSIEDLLAGGEPPVLGNVLQVTPTLLALLGIPASRAMPEGAMTRILDEAALANAGLPPAASHDEGFRPPARIDLPEGMNESFLKRFRDLGYIGSEEEPR